MAESISLFKLSPLVFDNSVSLKWPKWKEMFLLNMKASGKTKSKDEEMKIALLLTHMGEAALDVYHSFGKGKVETLESLLKAFDDYCVPIVNLSIETYQFNHLRHKPGQSFESFLTELRTQADKCKFVCSAEGCDQSYAERMITDHIVAHINDLDVQQTLLKETKTLKLDDVANLCRAAEMGKKYKQQMAGTESAADINALKWSDRGKTRNRTQGNNKNTTNRKNYEHRKDEEFDCKKCGSVHKPRKCPAYGYRCPICKKYNHYKVGCFKANNKKVHDVEKTDDSDSEIFGCESVEISCYDTVSTHHQENEVWKEYIYVNQVPVKFKLDTASDANILPVNIFDLVKDSTTKMGKSNIRLKSYGGFTTKPIGEVTLRCSYKNKELDIHFVLVDYEASPILGAKSCSKFGLVKRLFSVIEGDNTKTTNNESENKTDVPQDDVEGTTEENTSQTEDDLEEVKIFNRKFQFLENPSKKPDTQNEDEKLRFLDKNIDVFSGVGRIPYKIKLRLQDDAIPVVRPARRLPEILTKKLEIELARLENLGIIRKIDEPTEWVHDIVILEKPNGDVRLCLNPIPLNKYLRREHHAIPTLEELTSVLNGKEYYSVVDYREGFHQYPLDGPSQKLCTFNTPFGRYCYQVLAYGLSVAPEIFQRENTKIFGDIKGVKVLYDDIIITGKTEKEHDRNLEEVMKRARKFNVKLNKNKFQFKLRQVKYMGHIFSAKGMQTNPEKARAIIGIKSPSSVKELQRFLGAVNYINKFIPAYSRVTAPMRELLQKDRPWQWTSRQQEAFEKLKLLVAKSPTLKIFNPNEPVEVHCDASKDGIGACLLQKGQPVAFASTSLTSAEIRYSQIEKEMLGLVFAMKRFHNYIYGHDKVTVYTDHKPLLKIVRNDIHKNSARLQRMQLKILKYDFTLKYLPGPQMYIADMLSRAPLPESDTDSEEQHIVHAISLEEFLPIPHNEIEALLQSTSADPTLVTLTKYIHDGWTGLHRRQLSPDLKIYFDLRDNLFERDGLIFYDSRIVVPTELRPKMIKSIHSLAHVGINKTVARMRQLLYWPRMSDDIANTVGTCSVCNMFQNQSVKEPLVLTSIPQYPFQKIGMDIGEYQQKIFLAVEDYYSRWLEIIPLKTKTTTEIIKQLKILFSNFGIPEVIRSDNNPFSSAEMNEFAKAWGFKIITSSPHYPKSNGLSEKGIGIAKKLIKKSIQSGTDLQLALLEYRATPLTGLDYAPCQLMMNRLLRTKAPTTIDLLLPQASNDDVRSRMTALKMKQKVFYDSTAGKEKKFNSEQPIYIRSKDTWKEGWIARVLPEPRSYLVRDKNGQELRRNSAHLKARKLTPDSKKSETPSSILQPEMPFVGTPTRAPTASPKSPTRAPPCSPPKSPSTSIGVPRKSLGLQTNPSATEKLQSIPIPRRTGRVVKICFLEI